MEINTNYKGFIKLSRKMLDWEHWGDCHTAQLFIVLLFLANHKPTIYKGVECGRGETFITIEGLSKTCRCSNRTIIRSLKKLVESGEIKRLQLSNKLTKTTICKYNKYQDATCGDTNALSDNFGNDKHDNTWGDTNAHKQEYIYNKNSSSSNKIENKKERGAKEILEEMLSSGIIVEQFCKNEGISVRQFKKLADEVIIDWEMQGATHNSERDIRQHLLSHIRILIQKRNLINDDKERRVHNFKLDCRELRKEGFPEEAINDFFAHYTQEMNDKSGRMLFEATSAFNIRYRFITFFRKNYGR